MSIEDVHSSLAENRRSFLIKNLNRGLAQCIVTEFTGVLYAIWILKIIEITQKFVFFRRKFGIGALELPAFIRPILSNYVIPTDVYLHLHRVWNMKYCVYPNNRSRDFSHSYDYFLARFLRNYFFVFLWCPILVRVIRPVRKILICFVAFVLLL